MGGPSDGHFFVLGREEEEEDEPVGKPLVVCAAVAFGDLQLGANQNSQLETLHRYTRCIATTRHTRLLGGELSGSLVLWTFSIATSHLLKNEV